MRKIIFALVLALIPFGSVGAAYYLDLGGVDGETTAAPDRAEVDSGEAQAGGNVEMNWKVEEGESAAVPGVEPDEIDVADDGEQEGRTDALMEIDTIKGEDAEGTSIEPDEIDVNDNGEPITPNFSILLGGGSGDDADDVPEENRAEVAEILLEGMQADGMPTESVSLNFGKIKTTVKQTVKLFGFIPIAATATVEIDAEQQVKVKFPWWAFLASGKNKESLGQQVFTALSNVLKTKYDTIKNSINNIR